MEHRTRAVLVGCGGISRIWLKAAHDIPELEIVGLVDINREEAVKAAAEFGLHDAVLGTQLEAVLESVAPEVLFNCTVPSAHLDVTLTALGAGCHVLTEKPLADSMANARRMIAAAQAAGRTLAVIQNRRYDARIRRLRAFLESGVLGPITAVHSDFFLGAHTNSFRDHIEHPLLLDMAVHTFDAARLLTGADAQWVFCHEWNPAGSWFDHEAAAVAIFQMERDVVYTYRGCWCAEGLNTTWESDWRIIGTRGSVRWDGADGFYAQVVAKTGGFHSEMRELEVPACDAGSKVGGHTGNIREFIRCLRSGGTPETICTDNIKSLAMAFAAVESAELRKPVEVSVV